MCIMTVREGQHHSTVAQGCLHNLNTVISDLEMFSRLLESERNILRAAQVEEVKVELDEVQYKLKNLYGNFVADRLDAEHVGEHHASAELTNHVNDILLADVREAKAYETRSKIVEGDFAVPHTPPFDSVGPEVNRSFQQEIDHDLYTPVKVGGMAPQDRAAMGLD